jgi:acyl carrier protein
MAMSTQEAVRAEFGQEVESDRPLLSLPHDSLEFIEACLHLEQEFSIIIPEETIARLQTIGDLVDAINSLRHDLVSN